MTPEEKQAFEDELYGFVGNSIHGEPRAAEDNINIEGTKIPFPWKTAT